jgi:hypothetical protein
MSQHAHDPEMSDVERALSTLQPTKARLDRDRLMFEAGRRSMIVPSRLRWAWPAVAASLAAVVLGQTVALGRRPAPELVERVVIVREPAVELEKPVGAVVILSRTADGPRRRADDVTSAEPSLSLRRQIERYGLEGIPNPSPFLTLSAGAGGPSDASPDSHEVLRPYDLDKVLDIGGPS